MSYARTCIKGLVVCDSRRAFRGFTLLTPVSGDGVWMVDLLGEVADEWRLPYPPADGAELLLNGNLLYTGWIEGGPLADVEGAGGLVQELDASGAVVWEYRDSLVHHASRRTRSGYTLVMKWCPLPQDYARQIQGGDEGSERDGIMYGEVIQEIRPSGKVAWEWVAHEQLDPGLLHRCPLCPRDTWLHANGCQELLDGNILVSFAKVNTVAILDKKTGRVVWHWGTTGELTHQHAPTMLENGNILVFDNGFHPNGMAQNYSRLLEIDPAKNEMVWSYEGPAGGRMKQQIYSSMYSNAQRLPNGNTLGCEGMTGRVFEVTREGELVWEYVNHLPQWDVSPTRSRSYPVYSAYRYGMDYPGLQAMR
ncbi:MAG: aryl-sulfate sulfotransferase [Spirochaetales bacterium]|nr:aryl-sulfate sulfotransferase [Spirochaetales bacterium]